MNFNMEEHLKVERSVVYGQKCVQISTSYKIFRNKTWNLIPTTSNESKVKTILSFCCAHTFRFNSLISEQGKHMNISLVYSRFRRRVKH